VEGDNLIIRLLSMLVGYLTSESAPEISLRQVLNDSRYIAVVPRIAKGVMLRAPPGTDSFLATSKCQKCATLPVVDEASNHQLPALHRGHSFNIGLNLYRIDRFSDLQHAIIGHGHKKREEEGRTSYASGP
jgi:hypothetical protein